MNLNKMQEVGKNMQKLGCSIMQLLISLAILAAIGLCLWTVLAS